MQDRGQADQDAREHERQHGGCEPGAARVVLRSRHDVLDARLGAARLALRDRLLQQLRDRDACARGDEHARGRRASRTNAPYTSRSSIASRAALVVGVAMHLERAFAGRQPLLDELGAGAPAPTTPTGRSRGSCREAGHANSVSTSATTTGTIRIAARGRRPELVDGSVCAMRSLLSFGARAGEAYAPTGRSKRMDESRGAVLAWSKGIARPGGVPPIRRTRMFASPFPLKSLRFAMLVALALVLCAPAPGARAHDRGRDGAGARQAATGGDPYVAAVGDMGCSQWDPDYNNGNGTATRCRQKYVSDLLVSPVPDALLLLGDNQYDEGELDEFQEVYHPTFGRANTAAFPSLGNAEYDTPGAQGYFDYFSSVGVTGRIGAMAGRRRDSLRERLLQLRHRRLAPDRAQLELRPGGRLQHRQPAGALAEERPGRPPQPVHARLLAPPALELRRARRRPRHPRVLDRPLCGQGRHRAERPRQPPLRAVHASERQRHSGPGQRRARVHRQHRRRGTRHASRPRPTDSTDTTEISDYTSFGILKLSLRPASYTWQFVPEVGGSFTDSGSGTCHSAPAAQAPSAPTLAATADSAVHLSWNAPSDGGAQITGYKLYRGTAAGGETLYKTLGNVTSYDDSVVNGGTEYYYRVAAVNSVGDGAQSNEVSATPTAPPPAASLAPRCSTPSRGPPARSARTGLRPASLTPARPRSRAAD